jgi:hypothetical protein
MFSGGLGATGASFASRLCCSRTALSSRSHCAIGNLLERSLPTPCAGGYCGREGRSGLTLGDSLSRIWDLIKAAEQWREGGATSERSSHSGKSTRETLEEKPREAFDEFLAENRPERRISARRVQRVALLVYGSDADKRPFHEQSYTLEVNDGGCLLSLENPAMRSQRLLLINPQGLERQCRVVRVSRRVAGKSRVAIELIPPDPLFWNGALPVDRLS